MNPNELVYLHTFTCTAVGEYDGCDTNVSMYVHAVGYTGAMEMFQTRLNRMGMTNPDNITITDEGEV